MFHAEQALVYERLLAGDNVVLSAPTSFGKSLIVDAILAARNFRNAVVVVPTLALMDECRRRLNRLGGQYKIITHGTQNKIITHGTQIFAERNLFIMTQERILELSEMPAIDFFVIDEFYKLDPEHTRGDERSSQLNIVLRQLMAMGAQFYMLGPNITGLTSTTGNQLRATFVNTEFTTVATEVERVAVPVAELPDALATACREADGPTLVFCRSPQRTREVAEWLLSRDVGGGTGLGDAADWIGRTYHPDWLVGRALRAGIGVHHGRLPRALGHHIIRLFNEGRLPYLLVTSTLIEGVNTAARNVMVLDNKIAKRKYDYFTFANIRGRSGRMSQHFVGRVTIFNPEPAPTDLFVDVPVLSQSDRISDEILMQLPQGELTEENRARLRPYIEQAVVDFETLRANKGVSPALQMKMAERLASEPQRWANTFNWRGSYPTNEQVRVLGELLFTLTGSSGTVRSAAQLGARVNVLRHHRGDLRALVNQQMGRGQSADDAVEDALDFARNWAQFKIPTALMTARSLAADVLGKAGYSVADTAIFAGELENMFLPPFVTVLEEYGLPTAVTIKLQRALRLDRAVTLDDVLLRLRDIWPPNSFDPFEQEMLADTQGAL